MSFTEQDLERDCAPPVPVSGWGLDLEALLELASGMPGISTYDDCG